MKTIVKGLTYDDVLIIPRLATVMPEHTDISTQFTRNIKINAPICSSPMDTVTHHQLAIAIALHGGIGIMERSMTIEAQCEKVKKVKRYMSEVVVDPYTLTPQHTVADAFKLMQENSISGIPIIAANGRLVGIITSHDLQFESGGNATLIDDIMTKDNLITAPVGITPREAQKIFHETHMEKLLLVDHDFMLRGLMTYKDTKKKIMFPHATLCSRGQLRVGAAVGATADFYERACALRDAGADVIVIDTAHGHSQNVLSALVRIVTTSGMVDVVAGNIATREAAHMLCENGAAAVRVGMGPASICTTRIIAGIGVPQISAIEWAAEGVQGKIPVIADGGIRFSGDITKAIAAGASCVMIGSLFAGTDESPGETILYNGRTYKSYRGMGSVAVIQKGGDRYGNSAIPEGIEGMVPAKGPLALVFGLLIGGLREGMGYAGCANIQELQRDTEFVQITDAGRKESHVHDVTITHEAPNYQMQQ